MKFGLAAAFSNRANAFSCADCEGSTAKISPMVGINPKRVASFPSPEPKSTTFPLAGSDCTFLRIA